jgi:hypothetical protein
MTLTWRRPLIPNSSNNSQWGLEDFRKSMDSPTPLSYDAMELDGEGEFTASKSLETVLEACIGDCKRAALATLQALGVSALVAQSSWRRHRLLILCYHGISSLEFQALYAGHAF